MSGRLPAKVLAAAAVALLVAAVAFPLYWTAVASVTPEARLFEGPTLLPPRDPVAGHYLGLFAEHHFHAAVLNSLIVAGATTLVCLLLGSLCAYAVARLPMRGKAPILAFVLAVSVFPQISIVSPLYLLLRWARLLDTYPGLVLPYTTFALPLAVWLLVGFFRQIPKELEEAAMIDGASRLRTLWEVVLPLAAPGMVATAILTFVYCWNEFLFALSFTVGPDRQTVPVAIAFLRGRYQVPWGQTLAAAVVAVLPVALLVLAFQRRIVSGLTAGAVKE